MNDIPLGVDVGTDELYEIDTPTRRQHIYIIGKTGTGKSTLLEGMMLSDIRAGRGFCLIDPHGSLAYKMANAVGEIDPRTKQDRVNDTILFDPLSEHVPVYNPLRDETTMADATLVNHASTALKHVFYDSWGNRMEDCLKNAMRLALDNKLSLADVPRILNDDDWRESLTCNNAGVATYWQTEYANYTDSFRDQVTSPILNKLRAFDTDPLLKRIVDGETTLKIPHIMNTGKILLVSLSKRMGVDPSHVLGSLIVSRIAQAALERETIPEEERQDFTLYIDEFQNFTNDAMAEILAEARKYRLHLVLCHQYREQIENRNLREAVLASASTLIVFRVGATDADDLVKELDIKDSWGSLQPEVLSKLENYQAYVKTMVGPRPTEAVLIKTIPQMLPAGSLKRVQITTRTRYTRTATKKEGSNRNARQHRARD